MRQTRVADGSQFQVQARQIGQPFDGCQSGVGDFRPRQIQVRQAGQLLQRRDHRIAYARALRPEVGFRPMRVHRDRPDVHAELSDLRCRLGFVGTRFEVRGQTGKRIRWLRQLCLSGFGPVGALIDPVAYQLGLLPAQWIAFVGHDVVIALRQGDAPVHLAFLRVARNDHHAVLAPFHRGFFGVQPQLRLLFLRSVTLDAALLEDRLNLLGEINFVLGARPPVCERDQRDSNGNELFHMWYPR